MTRVFIPGADLTAPQLSVAGPDFHHLAHVLRIKPGDAITVLDNRGMARGGVVTSVRKSALELQLGELVALPPEPMLKVTIAQALGKGDKFEQVIQHGTEIGAHAFIPLITTRTIVKIDKNSADEKLERWQRVAKGAAEQCGRGRIPQVMPPASLAQVLNRLDEYDAAYLAHVDGEPVPVARGLHSVLILVGPEGGFAPEEVVEAVEVGARSVSLGPYVLRTETAALAALCKVLM